VVGSWERFATSRHEHYEAPRHERAAPRMASHLWFPHA
jgi:hypothetical protein